MKSLINNRSKSLKSLKSLLSLFSLILLATSCVKEPLHDTDHPEHAKITLASVWDDRGESIDIPGNYTAVIGEYTAILQGTTNKIENLFPAGNHSIHIYNVADNIAVSGTTATANYVAGVLGWFFTGTENITVEKDKDHAITVPMHQQVRQLTLELEITGNAADRITKIEASLSGIAGAIHIENGNPVDDAVTVAPLFAKTDGKYIATLRLLGITGNEQTLALNLYADNGATAAFTVTSDLASQLAAFNANKKTPLALRSSVETNLTASGFTATIAEWQSNSGGSVIAD